MGLYYAPRAQEQDGSGNALGGAKLFFYEVGTSTKKTIYSDKALSSSKTNPVVADSAGRFDNIYTDGAYKIILAPSTDSDPPTSAIWTEDDITYGGSGDFWGDTNDLTSTTAINATHEKELLRCSGTFNLNLLAVATAGKGFVFFVKNDGTGIITIDPNSAEQINDKTIILLAQGDGGTISCDGSEWTFDAQEAFKPWAKGADVTSAADLDITTLDGNYFDVTGTNAITTIKTTGKIGSMIVLHFDAALTFTHDATNLILPGAANITTVAGDEAILIEYASADYRCINYSRAEKREIWAKGGDLSSASPLVVDTDGNYFDVTGTTGFAAMTIPAGMLIMLQFDDVLVLTHDATNLDLPGEANITTAAGDSLIGFATAANQVHVINYTRASGVPILSTQTYIQKVIGTSVSSSTTTTLVPHDDTIPQNDEGAEVVTVSITPKNTSNRLIIRGIVHWAHNAAGFQATSLFQDTTANALNTSVIHKSESGSTHHSVILHEMAAGTTSSTTFKLRTGNDTTGTTTINGDAGARTYGGVLISSIEIIEVTS